MERIKNLQAFIKVRVIHVNTVTGTHEQKNQKNEKNKKKIRKINEKIKKKKKIWSTFLL